MPHPSRSSRSITWKVNIIVILVILGILTIMGALSYLLERRAIYADAAAAAQQIARRIEQNLVQAVWEYNYPQINLGIELEMDSPHLYAILFKDQTGSIKAGKVRTPAGDLLNYQSIPNLDAGLALCYFRLEVPIKQQNYVMGTTELYLTDRAIREQLTGLLLRLLAQFLLLAGILYVALLLSLRRLILRPISLIDDTVQRFAATDLVARVTPLPDDELGRLGQSFNTMADTIAAYSSGLEDKVRERTKELEDANRELEDANLFQTRFFANISHEFRTPLTLILGPVDAIGTGVYGEQLPRNHPIFQTIYQNGARLLKLINNILDFSKIEAGKMQVSKTRVSIAHLLEFYVSTIQAAASLKGLKMFFNNNADDDVAAWIDQDLFEKAAFNLLSNACKFTPAGGQVLVQLDIDADANTFSVSVKDSGIGIPTDRLDSIFDRFHQVKQAHHQHNEGTGIGLALAQEIAHLHQGAIDVKSRVGHGSTFTLTLPRGQDAEQTTPQQGRLPDSVQDLPVYWFGSDKQAIQVPNISEVHQAEAVILIVDDAADMREFLASVLADAYAIIQAHNGQEGLKRAVAEQPDLIITDVMMPEMDGYELASKLREIPEFAGTPILFVSARAEEGARIRGFEQGANDYLVKPFSPDELRARVNANLEMQRLRRQAEVQRDRIAAQKEQVETALDDTRLAYTYLEASARYFREIADLLPLAIVEIDRQGTVTYLNRAGQEFFELTPEAVAQGCRISDYVHYDERERFAALIANPEAIDQLAQYTVLTANRVQRVALVKAAPIFEAQHVSGVRLVLLEVQASLNLLTMPTDEFYAAYQISKREQEVLAGVVKGLKNKEIADMLYITEITVKKHVSSILQKTDCYNRDELCELLKTQVISP